MPTSTADLLKRRLHRFSRALPGVEQGDPISVHRARVASRRLRELIPILQLDADLTKKLGRRLRRITHQLGTIREQHVLARLVEGLRLPQPIHRLTLKRIGVAVTRGESERLRKILRKTPVDDFRRLAHKLERVVDELRHSERARKSRRPTERGAAWAIDARVAHRAARLSAAIDEAGAVYLPGRLHDVRLALKKLRYAVELSAERAGAKRNAALTTLRRAQTLLGQMHDLQVLVDRVRDVQASLAPPTVTVWRELDALVLALENKCRLLHARYVRERDALQTVVGKIAAAAGRSASPSPSARIRGERAG